MLEGIETEKEFLKNVTEFIERMDKAQIGLMFPSFLKKGHLIGRPSPPPFPLKTFHKYK